MKWFIETYLPGVIYYLVLPAITGLASACYLQFAYYRRKQRLEFESIMETADGEDDDAEQYDDEQGQSDELDVTPNDDTPELIESDEPDAQSTAAPPEPEEEIKSSPDPAPEQQELINDLLKGTSEEPPEELPGHARSTEAELTDADTLNFFEAKAQEQEVRDPLQDLLLEREPATTTESASTLAPSPIVESQAALDDDLVRLILGSDFDFEKLDIPEQTSDAAKPTPPKVPEPASLSEKDESI